MSAFHDIPAAPAIPDTTTLRTLRCKGIPVLMNELTALERTALNAILDELGDGRTAIEEQVLHASVLSRENTGGGFFTELEFRGEVPAHLHNSHLGQNVWIGVESMSHGLGMILHLWQDRAPFLEGYAVAAENTSPIDFEQVPFALVEWPGPLPANGS